MYAKFTSISRFASFCIQHDFDNHAQWLHYVNTRIEDGLRWSKLFTTDGKPSAAFDQNAEGIIYFE